MDLSLAQATLLAGFGFLVLGILLFMPPTASILKTFPRSRRAAYVTMAIASVWTLYKVLHLGEADYGNYKQYIFIGFAFLALLAFKYAPDFLSVRGACIVYLLLADVLLTAAFGHYEEPLRLFMVTPIYLGIALSLYLAHSPFRLRDFFSWLFAVGPRARILGLILMLYGGMLGGIAFAY